jgi:hypothetical protein
VTAIDRGYERKMDTPLAQIGSALVEMEQNVDAL